MAKRVDPLKAKQAKQKKIAIGLCVFLAIVLFIQVPRTMKMLKGPQPVTTAAAAATTTTTPAAPAPGTSGGGIPAPAAPGASTATGAPAAAGTPSAAAPQPAVLIDSDVPAAAGEGQLRSFELFKAKDPFAQQNLPVASTGTAPAPASAKPSAEPPAPKPDTGTVIAPAAGAAPSGSTATPPPSGTTTAPAPTATPSTPSASAATTTSISVNGVAENVAPEATFPADDPVFVLVSTAKDGKSVRIGVAGGTYADGAATIKLTVGKPLKLRNTADGSEFVLLLNTVAGFAPPKQK